jgi:hypothetical protein
VAQANGVGANEAEAYGAALTQLGQQLFPEAPWMAELGVALHRRDDDAYQHNTLDDGQVRVTVGLTGPRLEELLRALAQQPLDAEPPALLADQLEEIYQRHLSYAVCRCRQSHFGGEPCTPPGADDLASDLSALAATVRLKAFYRDGIPLDGQQRPRRPITVMAEWRSPDDDWQPLPELPLTVIQPQGDDAGVLASTTGQSDEAGLTRFPLLSGQAWPGPVRVALDRQHSLGPLAPHSPPLELALTGRATGLHRWALVATVGGQGQQGSVDHFAQSLERALAARGVPAAQEVGTEVTQQLRTASANELEPTLAGLADIWQGSVDLLLRVELDSEYASRMGPHRLWYEARAETEVVDVWAGQLLTQMTTTATASGLGDSRANRAAQTALADRLAERLVADLGGVDQP